MKRFIFTLLLAAAVCGGCTSRAPKPTPEPTPDPHEGMVEVESGFGTRIWVEEYEDVPVSVVEPEDFSGAGAYVGDDFTVLSGLDVSEHQQEIDWAAVADSGVEFAVIRAGYRGYGAAGRLHADAFFEQNIEGAVANGLKVGVYFFSQAIDAAEAVEEAEFLLDLLKPYADSVTMPVFYDWEAIDQDTARTDGMTGDVITECAIAFCERIAGAGYAPGVYAYRSLAYYTYELPALKDYALWIGATGDYPDFYYAHELWQYSIYGDVAGIEGDVDLDLWFTEQKTPDLPAGDTDLVSQKNS